MVYIYFCDVLIIMITTCLDPGWGLGQTIVYYVYIPCWFYVNFCPFWSIRILRYSSVLDLFVCYMWYVMLC